MRKYHRKKILELLQTLEEATSEIRNLLVEKDTQTLINFLADCQDCAMGIGDFIVKITGEGTTKAVSYLKEYCEILYQISISPDGKNDSKDLIKLLKKQLIKILNCIKNELKADKIEIAFFPYKASLFDSLESIWLAAKDDPNCDTYVIPIPYFDRNSDGSFGRMHYEGDQYPYYVPIVDWRKYDVTERHPDVVFFHNPYDGLNYVTSIHPDFYAERLKNFTDLLVYSPYFVTGELIGEFFCVLPGTIYADKVIVQSEKIRGQYIRYFKEFEKKNNCIGNFGKAEDKFLALGSPKFDKTMNTKREDCDIPDEWSRLINGKKAVLYNTSVTSILQGNEQYLEKLRSVLDMFKNRNDVVLWWRPHPLSESTYSSMRPRLYNEYVRIVEEYKRQGFGIYDNSSDLHRAIAMSDAYYGDWSSLVAMYNATGKPALIQQELRNDIINAKNELKISVWDFSVKDNVMWFVTWNINGLFSMDMDTKTVNFIGEIPYERAFDNYLAVSVKIIENYVILIPGMGKNIVKYDMKNGKFESVPSKFAGINNIKFLDAFISVNDIYMIPHFYPALVKFNAENNTLTPDKKMCADLDRYNPDGSFYFHEGSMINVGNHLMLASNVGNIVVKYDMNFDKYTINSVGNSENRYMCITYDGNNYWLFPQKGSIVKWNEKTGEVDELNNYPQGFNPGKNYSFITAVTFEKSIFVFPLQANMILKIDTETNEIESFINLDERRKYSSYSENYQGENYLCAKRIGDYIYASSQYESSLQRIEPKTGEIENIPFILSDKDYEKIMEKSLFNAREITCANPFQNYENPVLNLEFFLDRLISESIKKDNISFENTHKIFENSDGTCGEKVHEFVKSEVLN